MYPCLKWSPGHFIESVLVIYLSLQGVVEMIFYRGRVGIPYFRWLEDDIHVARGYADVSVGIADFVVTLVVDDYVTPDLGCFCHGVCEYSVCD